MQYFIIKNINAMARAFAGTVMQFMKSNSRAIAQIGTFGTGLFFVNNLIDAKFRDLYPPKYYSFHATRIKTAGDQKSRLIAQHDGFLDENPNATQDQINAHALVVMNERIKKMHNIQFNNPEFIGEPRKITNSPPNETFVFDFFRDIAVVI